MGVVRRTPRSANRVGHGGNWGDEVRRVDEGAVGGEGAGMLRSVTRGLGRGLRWGREEKGEELGFLASDASEASEDSSDASPTLSI